MDQPSLSKADQIRELMAQGERVSTICRQVDCHRSYVYKVAEASGYRESILRKLDEILRELREYRAEWRRANGIPEDIIRLKLSEIE